MLTFLELADMWNATECLVIACAFYLTKKLGLETVLRALVLRRQKASSGLLLPRDCFQKEMRRGRFENKTSECKHGKSARGFLFKFMGNVSVSLCNVPSFSWRITYFSSLENQPPKLVKLYYQTESRGKQYFFLSRPS